MKKKKGKKYGQAQFVKELWGIMEKQASENPEIALLHEKLSGEFAPPAGQVPIVKKGPILIGLTGGIASGKSLLSSTFKKKKVPVIDADQIAHKVIQKGKPAYREVIAVFGAGILQKNGEIDRKKLGSIIFTDADKRRLLESITHPEISKVIQDKIRKKKKSKMIVIDAALLFESGLSEEMAKNIVVTIDPNIQLKRLMNRDKIKEPEAWQRILSQFGNLDKVQKADFVIDNSGTVKETLRQMDKIFSRLR
ncbi:MAG: dephospho-CoA kinase [Deltaproteobacteria bacterium]|nr:dephospho-CoA kinase [Deltaproteobacteria bacterium]